MTDKKLRLAFDEADTSLRRSGSADEPFEDSHLTILCVQAETEWRDITVPIREKLTRSKRPFDFEGLARSRRRATTSRPRDAHADGGFRFNVPARADRRTSKIGYLK